MQEQDSQSNNACCFGRPAKQQSKYDKAKADGCNNLEHQYFKLNIKQQCEIDQGEFQYNQP